ncbi:MAG: ECF transporter S component [Actinomycetales bacterium]|nr:ECF transporter S component [Actinomycetales bacterium]
MSQIKKTPNLAWRGVDLVTTAILAAALGVAFWGFDTFVYPITSTIANVYPSLGELQLGVWIIPAVLGGVLVRKPGAALYAELIAASLELVLGGNPWSYTVLISGACQAIGVELVMLAIAYRALTLPLAALGGAISAAAEVVYEYFSWVPTYSVIQKVIYMICGVLSGALIAGGVGWGLVRLLGRLGVLNSFAAGREARMERRIG